MFPLAFKTTSSLRHRPLHSGRICSCCGHPNPWHPMATFKNWRRQKNGQSCAKKGLPVSAHCSSVAFQAQSPAPPVFFGSWCTKPAAKKWSNMLGFSLKEVGNFYQSRSSLFFWKQKKSACGIFVIKTCCRRRSCWAVILMCLASLKGLIGFDDVVQYAPEINSNSQSAFYLFFKWENPSNLNDP